MNFVIVGAAVQHKITTLDGVTYGGWTGTVESTAAGFAATMGADDTAHLIARIGDEDREEYEEHIRTRYGEGCDLSGLLRDPQGRQTHIAWETPDGWRQNRAHHRQTPIRYDEIAEDLLERADAVVFASGDVDNYDDALIEQVKTRHPSAFVYVDVHAKVREMDETGLWCPRVWKGWQTHLRLADVVQVSEVELGALLARTIDDMASARSALTELIRGGLRHINLTMGSGGVLIARSEGVPFLHVPSIEIQAVDLSGAGDAFAAAYIAASLHGLPTREAAQCGRALGALTCTKLGLLTPTDVQPGTLERLVLDAYGG